MIDIDSFAIRIDTWSYTDAGAVEMELRFGAADDGEAIAVLGRLRRGDGLLLIEGVRTVTPAALRRFLAAMRKLDSRLFGSCELVGDDRRPVLTFTLTNPLRGEITVGGRFVAAGFGGKAFSAGDYLGDRRTGAEVAFDGLAMEQSYVAEIVRGIAAGCFAGTA